LSKQDILLENGTFNRNHTKVTDQRFISDDFYDPKDLAQVKYEMLRTARESKESVEEISIRFGFSRAGFYKIKNAFEKEGISAFVSNKTGPRNAWKLTKEYQHFIDGYLLENPDASSGEIASILKAERGLEISKRTVERYRNRKGRHDRTSQYSIIS
jgi:transposase